MSDLQVIETAVKRSAQRRRLARAFRGMCVGLLAGSLVSLLASGIHHLLPLPDWVLAVVIVAPVVGGAGGIIGGAWRRPRLQETARWVDSRVDLKERLGTALEISKREELGRWRELVVRDAAEHARKIDPRTMVPYGLHHGAVKWALLVLAMVAGLAFIPEYRSKSYLQKQTDAQNIREVGKQLSELTKQSLAKRPPTLPETQKSMSAVEEAGSLLSKGELTRTEALKDLASLTEKLKGELHNMGQDPALRRMEQAARSSGAPDSQTSAAIQRELAALQKQLGSPSATPEALDKAKKQLDELREAASGQNGNGEMSQQDREKLTAGLSALSSQMQGMGLKLPEIDEAIKALAANQTEMLLKDLKEASVDLEKLRDMVKSMKQLQQQVEKMGKDLAEQLQNGQPEAANMTLQKMMEQLKSANLSSEQMKALMQEVSKAVAPASNYGKVAEHLKNAAAKMQGGNKQAAAQDLANASKELEKLMQQLGDAEQLAAELRTLNQASMFIANGQCWGMNKSGRPMAGTKKGRGGAGVGTWAENESAEWDGTLNDPSDASMSRPDMDARGLTDRDPNLNDALMPTKVKGQFSPGEQMPSVTLKGVSIRGQSSVEYQSAAAAAQSDAESALSQEKVPRAYQGAVKEYFDDLPKNKQ